MKNLPYFFLAAALGIGGFLACSRQQKTEKTASAQLRTHKEAIDTLRGNPNAATVPVQLTPQKNDEVFVSNDLSKLWMGDPEYSETAVMNGFYGTDHYRIEMYFASITKDAQKPNVYHVKGKSRFKKNITPFEGTIVLEELQTLHDPNIKPEELKEMNVTGVYTSKGTFQFQEDSTYSGSGVFQGKIAMDFAINNDKTNRLWYFSETDDAQGAGFLFDGDWTSYKTGKAKPIIWAKDIFMIGNSILKEFSIGERDVEINPKYRKLGWDNFWENDEWWNEPAKTTM